MAKRPKFRSASDVPKRYSRPFATLMAAAIQDFWRAPTFRFHRTEDFTEFVFKLPFSIPEELERRSLMSHHRLFPRGPEGLSKVFVRAYGSTFHKGKPIKSQFELLLRKVLVQAINILLEENKDEFHQDDARVKVEKDLMRENLIKTGRQPDERGRERTARRMAKRYQELLPQVRKIRQFVKQNEQRSGESELMAEIERAFPLEWVRQITRGCAFKKLLPIPGYEIETTLIGRWTARQLTVAIITCEEHLLGLGPTTIYEKYISLGNRFMRKNS